MAFRNGVFVDDKRQASTGAAEPMMTTMAAPGSAMARPQRTREMSAQVMQQPEVTTQTAAPTTTSTPAPTPTQPGVPAPTTPPMRPDRSAMEASRDVFKADRMAWRDEKHDLRDAVRAAMQSGDPAAIEAARTAFVSHRETRPRWQGGSYVPAQPAPAPAPAGTDPAAAAVAPATAAFDPNAARLMLRDRLSTLSDTQLQELLTLTSGGAPA
jgi:hypothetical protein